MSNDGQWCAGNPQQFVDRRTMLKRDDFGSYSKLVVQHVRAYRATVVRTVRDAPDARGRTEREICPHAHVKQSAARKCAEAAARRLNKKGAK